MPVGRVGRARRGLAARLLLAVLVASTLSVFGHVSPAAACSCAAEDPFTEFDVTTSEAAFIGTVTDMRPDPDVREVTWRFRAESVLAGDLPPVVDVQTYADAAGCGFTVGIGESRAVILNREGSEWMSNLCSVAPADSASRYSTGRGPNGALGTGITSTFDNDPAVVAAEGEAAGDETPDDAAVGDGLLLPVVGGVMLVTLLALGIGLALGRRPPRQRRRRKPPPDFPAI